MSDIKPVKIAGKLYWNKWMSEFNTHFNEDNTKYECTFGNISDAGKEKLEELGVKVKFKEEMGNYVVAKSKYVFEPVDPEGNKVDVKVIGAGTEAWALFSSYRHKMSAKHGAAPSIKKLVVTKLVEYEGAEGAAVEDEEEAL